MSPTSKVQSPKPAAPGARCVLRVGLNEHAPRTTQQPHVSRSTFHAPSSTAPARLRRAFTLIEIMIVVAIMGIVMTMGVPIVYKMWRKAPLRQAVKDIVEVLSNARARAIMHDTTTAVVIYPKQNRLELVGGGTPAAVGAGGGSVTLGTSGNPGSGLSAQLSDQIIIEELDINMSGIEFNDYDQVRVRFYPNGVSDEMRMILFDGRDRMGIELEITTGLANVVNDPLREWSKR